MTVARPLRFATKVSAIVVAAGSGSRLGRATPKAFVTLQGSPILTYTLRTLMVVPAIEEAVITVPAGMERAAREACVATGLEIPIKITPGGAERQDSVRVALGLTSAEAEYVAIHDAARPFVTAALFEACRAGAIRHGAAIAALPLADTLKRADPNHLIAATIPRAGLWQAQTPQIFRRDLLVHAHQRAAERHLVATDDAELLEQLGMAVALVEGSARNFKITTPADFAIAEALAASPVPMRRGLNPRR